jgi:hypothetical protein
MHSVIYIEFVDLNAGDNIRGPEILVVAIRRLALTIVLPFSPVGAWFEFAAPQWPYFASCCSWSAGSSS